MKRALVIGGTGFLGINIVDELLAAGVKARVSYRKKSITAFVSKRDVQLIRGDLEDEGSLVEAMQGCDVVFLAGAHYPRYSQCRELSIARGRRDVHNACSAAMRAGVKRLVYTSSIASLAQTRSGRVDEDDRPSECPSDSVYRATKWAMEGEVERARDAGLDIVTMLPGGCLGPWDVRLGTGGLLVGFITGSLPWWVDGIVNVVDVRDVAKAHVLAAMTDEPHARYCLGGTALRLRKLFRLVQRGHGGKFPETELDVVEAKAQADNDEREAMAQRLRVPMPRELVDIIAWSQIVDSGRAEESFAIQWRPLAETLDDACEWFARYRYLPRPEAGFIRDANAQRKQRRYQ